MATFDKVALGEFTVSGVLGKTIPGVPFEGHRFGNWHGHGGICANAALQPGEVQRVNL